jgi:hypothetical protein
MVRVVHSTRQDNCQSRIEVSRGDPPLDRYLRPDMDAALELCHNGTLLGAVERAIGPLC